MAFDILDTDKSGFVSVEEMMSKYDVSHNSEVQVNSLLF
jgi:Ca2+-binding EF-hand superfamily protein